MSDAFEFALEDRRAESAFIHPSSYVDSPCVIGERTHIAHFSHVMATAIIGNDCHIGHNVTIAAGVVVGDNVRVMNNTLLMSGVILENDVYCGPSTVFTPLKRVRSHSQVMSKVSPTVVRRGSVIGPNTTVATGFTIGQFCFVEAGSVIDRNIPDYASATGNPLRLVAWRCACGTLLEFKQAALTTCTGCSQHYAKRSEIKIQPVLSATQQEEAGAGSVLMDPQQSFLLKAPPAF
jgi:UDP-2-acetamido-3-amino-2,3-dideoxy-glucuronate N-acetyltransferase